RLGVVPRSPARVRAMSPRARAATPRKTGDRAAGHLDLAVSPYHLCTREVPAMAALTFGSSVVTLLPKPSGGSSREAVREAAQRAPHYLRLMESWRWSGPAWEAGVISGLTDGEDCADELPGVYESIRAATGRDALRALTGAAEARATDPF